MTNNLKQFNLKIGDRVIFPDYMREDGLQSMKGKLNVGEVIGIYPYIFHVRFYTGVDNSIPMYRSFTKVSYQIGEVIKEV